MKNHHFFARTIALFSFVLFLLTTSVLAQANGPKVLIISAHPDDESAYAATVYKITHDLKGKVDITVITNGEGGYKYSTIAEEYYGLELTDEKVGREFLPTIRKRELIGAGKIIGLRNFYFLDQKDNKYTQDEKEVLQGIWDVEFVKRRLNEIVTLGDYDFIFTLLPTPDTHGHHKAATLLALETVKNLKSEHKPIILGATVLPKEEINKFTFEGLTGYDNTKINRDNPTFTFDRGQRFGYKDSLTYKIVVNWLIAEHKSQGALQMGVNLGDIEEFWFYALNKTDGLEKVSNLFKQLKNINYKKREY